MEMKPICFDLEGPLAYQDNAYELMKLFPRGGKIFEVTSRYDDLLTLAGRPELPQTRWGRIIGQVKPPGGRRMVDALESFSTKMRKPLSSWTVVGHSIIHSKMLQAVNKSGGLAVAFNANEHALPYSTLGLASASLYDL